MPHKRLFIPGPTEVRVENLAALARPNLLLVAAAACVWVALSSGRFQVRAAAVPVLLLALGVVLAVAPVTLRNARVSGDPVLISSNGGVIRLSGVSSPNEKLLRSRGLNGRLPSYRNRLDAVFGSYRPGQPR